MLRVDDDLQGVHLLESTESAEIPGVESFDQDPAEDVPDLADAFDVDHDFDSHADPLDLVQLDNHSLDPTVEQTQVVHLGAGDGTGETPSVPWS
jgi:hypothetical protein